MPGEKIIFSRIEKKIKKIALRKKKRVSQGGTSGRGAVPEAVHLTYRKKRKGGRPYRRTFSARGRGRRVGPVKGVGQHLNAVTFEARKEKNLPTSTES